MVIMSSWVEQVLVLYFIAISISICELVCL